jgi:hypothetical protein
LAQASSTWVSNDAISWISKSVNIGISLFPFRVMKKDAKRSLKEVDFEAFVKDIAAGAEERVSRRQSLRFGVSVSNT